VYTDRVANAILECLYKDFVKWSDPDEPQVIAHWNRDDFGLPNCIGIADVTLLPLAFCPSTDNYANYKDIKMLYMLTMLVVNNNERQIHYFYAGWPGSTHNDWVFQNSRIVQDLGSHFRGTEYIIGDRVRSPQNFMASTYKKPVGTPLHPDNEVFNKKLAKPCVSSSENTIGILK
jgi:hypothetical protein